jgi:hypothetical protein
MSDFQKIKWREDYWLDTTKDGIVIRDAIGQVIFRDIQFSEADLERVAPHLVASTKKHFPNNIMPKRFN